MNKKTLGVALVLAAGSVALFGTSANADPVVRDHRTPAAPADPPGMVTVKFGVQGGGMTSKELKQAFNYQCGNALFGDPAPGQKKACYLANGEKIAEEGQLLTTPGPACPMVPVKYVAVNGATKERTFCAGRKAYCSNAVFGTDPAVGVKKHCEINGKTVAQESELVYVPFEFNCLCNGKTLGELPADITTSSQY